MAFESTAAVGQPFAERGAFHDPCLAPLEGSGSSAGSRCPLPDILVPSFEYRSYTGFDEVDLASARRPVKFGSSPESAQPSQKAARCRSPPAPRRSGRSPGPRRGGDRDRLVVQKPLAVCNPRVEVGDEPSAAQVHPWHRYFARSFDYLCNGVVGILDALLFRGAVSTQNTYVVGIIAMLIAVPIESLLLSS